MGDEVLTCKICSINCTGPKNFEEHLAGAKHLKKAKLANSDKEIPTSSSGAGDGSPLQNSEYACSVCQTVMSGPGPYMAHMSGQPHARKLKQLEKIQKFQKEHNLLDASQNSSLPESTDTIDGNLNKSEAGQKRSSTDDDGPPSKRKQSYLYLKTLPNGYFECTACGKNISGPENVNAHLSGKRHERRVARMEGIAKLPSDTLKIPEELNGENKEEGTKDGHVEDISEGSEDYQKGEESSPEDN